jgi:hypothetical protein
MLTTEVGDAVKPRAPLVIGVVAIIAARMTRDEIANPLDVGDETEATAAVPSAVETDLVPAAA